MNKVKCPKCGNTWWTNIRKQRCVSKECNQQVDMELHKVPEPDVPKPL